MPSTAFNAPGCFGFAACYLPESEHCQKCALRRSCHEKVGEVLEVINQAVDVTELKKRHRNVSVKFGMKVDAAFAARPAAHPARIATRAKIAPTQEQAALIAKLPVKTGELLALLIRNNHLAAMQSLPRQGKNPFAGKTPKWLATIFDALIAGSASRSDLTQLLIERHDWSKATAQSSVSMVAALLPALGIADFDAAGKLNLRKTHES